MSHQTDEEALGFSVSTLPPPRSRELASVFDQLTTANLRLAQSVGQLVRLSWAVIGLNLALITAVAVLLAWMLFGGRQPTCS